MAFPLNDILCTFSDIDKWKGIFIDNPDLRWRSPKHDVVGAEIAERFLRRIGYQKDFIKMIVFLVKYHMYFISMAEVKEKHILSLYRKADELNIDSKKAVEYLLMLMEFDSQGIRHVKNGDKYNIDTDVEIDNCVTKAKELMNTKRPEIIKIKPFINGDYLIKKYGMKQSKELGDILKELVELQISGEIEDTSQAEKWVEKKLKS
jgi:tRNA nucleotidyltransferase/poly(A) polymerase